MSGCLIAGWAENGWQFVGHIGMVESNEQLKKVGKQTFAQYMPYEATGFHPPAAWDAERDTIPKAHMLGRVRTRRSLPC